MFDDDPSARFLAAAVTETLVRRDEHDDAAPRLAESVPTLENGGMRIVTDDPSAPQGRITATFRLREATWQDGEPITASDVVFAWEHDRREPVGSLLRWYAERIDRIDVVGAREVRVAYRDGERWEDYAFAPRVLPRHRLENATPQQRAAYDREPVHAGPFAVAAWLPGNVTLSAFKSYVLGAPGLGRLEVHFYPTRAAVLQALQRGDVDIAPWPVLEADLARTLDRFADGARLQAYYKPAESLAVLRFGPNPKRFGDPAVRKAIELAIDRQSIVDDVFLGRARVPRTYLTPPLWAAVEESLPVVARDRDRAKALLADAGFTRGQFGILERSGERLITTIAIPAGSIARRDVARRVVGDLAAVGIAADVRERPMADLLADVRAGEFDLAITTEDASDPRVASERWYGLVDPWFDVLARAAAAAPDRADKRAIYGEMGRLWAAALPALPLYQDLRVDIAPQSLTHVQPSPSGTSLSWNAYSWTFVVR